jgi:hypothetical protein
VEEERENRMEFEQAKAGKLVVRELTQRMLERFTVEYRKLAAGPISVVEDHGATLRAAITAEWIEEPKLTIEQVDNLPPWKVDWLASGLDAAYREARTVPNE